MIRRLLLAGGMVVLMLLSGLGSYMYLGGRQSKVAAPPEKPTAATPRAQAFVLPGTLYLAQEGAIYSLNSGRFHQLTAEAGWTMPSLAPDGTTLIAVNRTVWYSEVYYLTRYGGIIRRVTDNNVRGPHPASAAYHWSFYPRMSADGKTLWLAYDKPKFGYDVVFSIWNSPANGMLSQGHLWSNSIDYTGGDTNPLPLAGGGVLYTKYSYYNQHLISQLWMSTKPEVGYYHGTPLTAAWQDCSEPSLSPDGGYMAMICTYDQQISELTIATWNGHKLGPLQAVLRSQLVAQPVWAPDGSGIAYFAPGAPDGPFQLWWLPRAAYFPPAPPPIPTPTPVPGGPHNGPLASPTPVVVPPPPAAHALQVTADLGFDATSPIAWAP